MAITLQGFGILPKIREVDARMRPDLQDPRRAPCVLESHPELIFRDLNGGTPVVARKRSRQGRADRLELLERAFGMAIEVPRLTPGAAADDTLDALACLWVAMAPADDLQPIPAEPEHDSRGLHMAMWRRTVTPGIAPHRETLRLGYVEVDSGALIVGDPLYVLPQADAGRAGVDYAEVAATPDKPALYLAGRPVLLLQQFGGDGTYPVIGEFERGRLVRVRIDLDVEPEE